MAHGVLCDVEVNEHAVFNPSELRVSEWPAGPSQRSSSDSGCCRFFESLDEASWG